MSEHKLEVEGREEEERKEGSITVQSEMKLTKRQSVPGYSLTHHPIPIGSSTDCHQGLGDSGTPPPLPDPHCPLYQKERELVVPLWVRRRLD